MQLRIFDEEINKTQYFIESLILNKEKNWNENVWKCYHKTLVINLTNLFCNFSDHTFIEKLIIESYHEFLKRNAKVVAN